MIAALCFFTGLAAVIAGLTLWLGLPAGLIAGGIGVAFAGYRLDDAPAEASDGDR